MHQFNNLPYALLPMILLVLISCETIENSQTIESHEYLAKSSFIALNGESDETVYLSTVFRDKGAYVVHYGEHLDNCTIHQEVTDVRGTVDTKIPGNYLLFYHATDMTGKALTVATRTVHVIENKAGFLNGRYEVTNTCTTTIFGSIPTISSETYTAIINSGASENEFELISLKIGREFIVPSTSLNGNDIYVGYFSPDYSKSAASGTLAASKNSFTIESTFYPYSPKISYKCRNVFTKLLVPSEPGKTP